MGTEAATKSAQRSEFQSPWAAVSSAVQPPEIRDVAIIGAGVAGLCTAKTLMAEGLRCTIFERNAELGGVWANGYANFGVQVQKELYEIPDWPLPLDAPDFTPGPVFREYLQGYSDHFGITPCIRFGAAVMAMERRDDRGWTLTFQQGGEERRDAFDLVVVSVGLYSSRPNLPRFPSEERFGGEILHISGLKSREQLRGKRVAVVGYGKSATDAAVESAAVADRTTLIFREAHWPVPRKLAGILPFKWGMFHRLTSAFLPPYQRPSALERTVHALAQPAVWLFWRLVEVLLRYQFGLGSRFGSRADLVPKTPVEVDAFGESTMLPRPEFFRLVRGGIIDAQRTEIVEYRPGAVALGNGISREVDVVILATGWTTDYGFLPEAVREHLSFESDGYYLYRHMLHPDVPDIALIGCDAATFSCVLTGDLRSVEHRSQRTAPVCRALCATGDHEAGTESHGPRSVSSRSAGKMRKDGARHCVWRLSRQGVPGIEFDEPIRSRHMFRRLLGAHAAEGPVFVPPHIQCRLSRLGDRVRHQPRAGAVPIERCAQGPGLAEHCAVFLHLLAACSSPLHIAQNREAIEAQYQLREASPPMIARLLCSCRSWPRPRSGSAKGCLRPFDAVYQASGFDH